MAYTKPQEWKKEESERLRGERDLKDGNLQDSGRQHVP